MNLLGIKHFFQLILVVILSHQNTNGICLLLFQCPPPPLFHLFDQNLFHQKSGSDQKNADVVDEKNLNEEGRRDDKNQGQNEKNRKCIQKISKLHTILHPFFLLQIINVIYTFSLTSLQCFDYWFTKIIRCDILI